MISVCKTLRSERSLPGAGVDFVIGIVDGAAEATGVTDREDCLQTSFKNVEDGWAQSNHTARLQSSGVTRCQWEIKLAELQEGSPLLTPRTPARPRTRGSDDSQRRWHTRSQVAEFRQQLAKAAWIPVEQCLNRKGRMRHRIFWPAGARRGLHPGSELSVEPRRRCVVPNGDTNKTRRGGVI